MLARTRSVAAVLLAAASPSLADPGTLVSFAFTTTGQTSADATAACLTPGCNVVDSCTTPNGSFSLSRSSLSLLNQNISAQSSCVRTCSCCAFSGGGGSGNVQSTMLLFDPMTSADSTRWIFRDEIDASSAATGVSNPGCVIAAATCFARATYRFDLVFDTSGTTRLSFSRQHTVTILAASGGAATSTISLRDDSAPIFGQVLSVTAGSQGGAGLFEVVLPQGRYSLSIEGLIQADAASPGGASSVGTQAFVEADLTLTPYVCPQVTSQPASRTVAAGAIASFSVGSTGTSPTYQWRRNGISLSNGATTSGSSIYGATTPSLSIYSSREADQGLYDCVITSLCASVTSNAATLRVCSADLDGNGRIEPADLAIFVTNWEASLRNNTLAGDFDGNGRVEPADVAGFVTTWRDELVNGC